MGTPARQGVKVYSLNQEQELRVEVAWDSLLRLKLLQGTAEIFGMEIAEGQYVSFRGGEKFAVFTWYGCTLEVEGVPEVAYVADETPMVNYVNTHAVLDARRRAASEASTSGASPWTGPGPNPASQGPRAIMVGPTDSGKSTLTKVLVSYAARLGWKPTLVDLDIGQGSITVPGTIGATPVEIPIDPVDGVPLEVALVFYFGHVQPGGNPEIYKATVETLAALLERQFAANSEYRASGMLINTMGWVEGLGLTLLLHTVATLKADVVMVLGEDRLYNQLKGLLDGTLGSSGRPLDVVKLPKSGGVVARTSKQRQLARQGRIRDYFYGIHNDLSPHSITLSFSDVHIFRLGGGPQAPRSALPVGAAPTADPRRIVHVSVSQELAHAVLAVSHAKDQGSLLTSNVAGFVVVTDVDTYRRKLTVLSPTPGPLAGALLLAGSLNWVEQ